jgi:hypothetical protein
MFPGKVMGEKMKHIFLSNWDIYFLSLAVLEIVTGNEAKFNNFNALHKIPNLLY